MKSGKNYDLFCVKTTTNKVTHHRLVKEHIYLQKIIGWPCFLLIPRTTNSTLPRSQRSIVWTVDIMPVVARITFIAMDTVMMVAMVLVVVGYVGVVLKLCTATGRHPVLPQTVLGHGRQRVHCRRRAWEDKRICHN